MVDLAMILENVADNAWTVTDEENCGNDESHDTKMLFSSVNICSFSGELIDDKDAEDGDNGAGDDMDNEKVGPNCVKNHVEIILA